MLSSNTEVTLLLCGRFGGKQEVGAKPLEPREYDRLVEWLVERDLRPADLLDPDALEPGRGQTGSSFQPPVDVERLRALLERGGALALAVEGWQSRGLWVAGRADDEYPARFRSMGRAAPPLIYGAGSPSILGSGRGLAIVGSRTVDDDAARWTEEVARACASQGITVVSGGARGVDVAAMSAAVTRGGRAVGVLADSLARAAVSRGYRQALMEESLVLLSPYDPGSGFSVGSAMGRNRYIYALADAGLVISTASGEGGTWTGAVEALKRGTPVFVRADASAPPGNFALLELGAQVFSESALNDLDGWLREDAAHPSGEEREPFMQGNLW